ncbi:MAG: hypothetical protein QUS07_07340 [Methanothrix sp.]|nr:hypothetical protein [Methanothrix sp.]
MRVGETTLGFSDTTPVYGPDPNQYGKFVQIDSIQGAPERPTTSLKGYYPQDVSEMLRLANKGCRVDVQVHIGRCRHPQDFDAGWDKIRVYPDGRISSWADENAGALTRDDQNPVNETLELSAREVYELSQLLFFEKATTQAVREILDIEVIDTKSCGDCGEAASDGADRVFALMKANASSGGALPSVLCSTDGGTFIQINIDALANSDLVEGLAGMGSYLVVISSSQNGYLYAKIADILTNTETWAQVTTGFVSSKTPKAITAPDSRHIFICGKGGYIYSLTNLASGVTVQDAGIATVQDLAAIHAYDDEHVVAVGAGGAVVYTTNGDDWALATAPTLVDLISVSMFSETTWFVGTSSGKMYLTDDQGVTWTEVSLPVTLTALYDIKFVDEVEGYLTGTIAGPKGVILRTVNGGNSWYVLPEAEGAPEIPANDRINALAVGTGIHNIVYGAGLADDASAGFVVKAA